MNIETTEGRLAAALAEPGVYAVHLDEASLREALALCRGPYQRALVLGHHALSGATLRGRAASYARVYARSRDALLSRLYAAGVGREVRGPRGRRVLVIGG